MTRLICIFGTAVFIIIISITAIGRPLYLETDDYQNQSNPLKPSYDIDSLPYPTIAVHNVGKLAMTVSNFGILGLGGEGYDTDPLTGESAPSLQYPKGNDNNYMYELQLWIGGIVGNDTLVSLSSQSSWMNNMEFWPKTYPEGDISYRSINNRYDSLYDSAVSNQDFVAIYTDTLDEVGITGYDYYTGRMHRPLNVHVKQSSYAWAYDYAEDFIIIDYEITNMELRKLEDVYIGLMVDNDIGKTNSSSYGRDDITGYIFDRRSTHISGLFDTLNLFWAADNDGDPDPYTGAYSGYNAPTSIIATRVLRSPTDVVNYTYNWWAANYNPAYDWGPTKANPNGVRRFYDGRLGTAFTDEEKYYLMANGEFDYNQLEAYIDKSAEGWLAPPPNAYSIASGTEIKYVLSFGPFDIEPGNKIPLTIAIVMGQDFYKKTLPTDPLIWRDFSDLHRNALWAGWIYDNPGVDTDGDNYYGKFRTSCLNPKISRIDTVVISQTDTLFDTTIDCRFTDTLYYEGDGVPDFKGAEPPAAPKVRIYPRINDYNLGEIVIQWNGLDSENYRDRFSSRLDFEGYRIYNSRSGQSNDFTMITSYDVENYDRWEYNERGAYWEIIGYPYNIRQLKGMYGEEFDPGLYFNSDKLFGFYNLQEQKFETFYFTPHDWNQSDYLDPEKIHKLYPNQPYPSTMNVDTAQMFYPDEVTPEGNLKYFEYEYIMDNLIPSVPYYVSVCAFDAGFPGTGLSPIENKPSEVAIKAFAQNSSRLAVEQKLDVVVYPNPYRIDGNYDQYFEGWENPNEISDRQRVLHFTNLPPNSTIRIFTLDGDMLTEFYNQCDNIDDPDCTHASWNLVSRNDMRITSGIYMFSVESEYGNQVGKFVVIY